MGRNLSNLYISESFQYLIQYSGSDLQDGLGNTLTGPYNVTASFATSASQAATASYYGGTVTSASYANNATSASYAVTASYALNASATVSTASLLITASATNNVITFTKGDGSTFPVTVDTGSGGGAANTGSLLTTASFSNAQITFTKGDGSTFSGVINNVTSSISASFATNATSASFASTSANATSASFATNATSASFASTSTSASHALTANNATTASFASNIANGLNITASNVLVNNNLTVNGTASFAYFEAVTGSVVRVGESFILLNTSDTTRYAGLLIEDSGSAPTNYTASWFFDSVTNDWNYEYNNAGNLDFAVALFGPAYDVKGTPTYLTTNKVPVASGSHHLRDSNITDNGTTVSISTPLVITGSVNASSFTGSLQGTASFANNATSASFATSATSASFASTSTSASFATSASQAQNSVTASFALNATTPTLQQVTTQGATTNVTTTFQNGIIASGSSDQILIKKAGIASQASFNFSGDSLQITTNDAGLNNVVSFPGYSILSATNITASSITASLLGTASFASTSSFTPNALVTASVSSNVITFTKGDGSTFPITVNTGSGGGGGGISAPIVIPRTDGTASVSGFTGSLYVMDCASGSNFVINLTTSSLSILDPINITAGQEISLTINQTSSITSIDPSLSNLQFNTNINVPTSLTRYLMTVSSSAIDVVRFTAQNTSSLEAYGYYQNLYERAILTNPFITATGGTVTTDGNYRIHTFTGSGNFDVTFAPAANTIEYLVVAGGGGGGYGRGAGGGAGGLLSGSSSVTAQTYSITVGAGGNNTGGDGGNSVFSSFTAIGGGGGGGEETFNPHQEGNNGGSGGGAVNSQAAGLGTVGPPRQGYNGTTGGVNGGGGGGAGSIASVQNGGSGSLSSITGTPTYYAGGGGGSGNDTFGIGGIGGGGTGAVPVGFTPGDPGINGTGGGGGGGAGTTNRGYGGVGGSGIVIIRYQYQ